MHAPGLPLPRFGRTGEGPRYIPFGLHARLEPHNPKDHYPHCYTQIVASHTMNTGSQPSGSRSPDMPYNHKGYLHPHFHTQVQTLTVTQHNQGTGQPSTPPPPRASPKPRGPRGCPSGQDKRVYSPASDTLFPSSVLTRLLRNG